MFFIGMPLLLIPAAIYNIFAFILPDVKWSERFTTLHMMSGAEWTISGGDILVFGSLFCLYLEIFKAARVGHRSIVDHLLALALFAGMVAEFILWRPFATSTYVILIAISLIDVLAGFTITARTRERPYRVEPEPPRGPEREHRVEPEPPRSPDAPGHG